MGHFSENDIVAKTYRIDRLIGQGAFGEVYLATHTGLNGKRAIKVLFRDSVGLGSSDYEDYKNRFRQESQLMEWFNHPNIIRIYDFQEENDTLFLIMEYAAGGNLRQRLEKARKTGESIAFQEVVKTGIDIAEGLAVLHRKDVVHRDLKPSNILFDSDGLARVADLGLAQIPGGASMRSQLSVLKPHPGTPAYMSPEQEILGMYLRPASDVYSLGLILFEMLTGRGYKNIRPGTHVSDLSPAVPEWFDDLLLRMLADSAKERPWDGAETVQELRRGLTEGASLKRETVSTITNQPVEPMILRDKPSSENIKPPEPVVSEPKEVLKQDIATPSPSNLDGGQAASNEEITRTIRDYEEKGLVACQLQDWTSAKLYVKYLRESGPEGEQAADQLEARINPQGISFIKRYWWAIVGIVCLAFIYFIITNGNSISASPMNFSGDKTLASNMTEVSGDVSNQSGSGENKQQGVIDFFKEANGDYTSLTFSRDGKFLYSASSNNQVTKWNAQNFQLVSNLIKAKSSIYDLDVSPDGLYLSIGTQSDEMYAVDSQAGTTNFTLLFYKPVKRVKYSPDNKYIAGVDDTGHFCIIDNPRGATPIIKYDNNTSVTSVDIASPEPGIHNVAFATDDGRVKIFTIEESTPGQMGSTANIKWEIQQTAIGIGVAFRADPTFIIGAWSDGTVSVFDLMSSKKPITSFNAGSPISHFAYNARKDLIATGGIDGKIRVFKTNGQIVRSFQNSNPVLSIAFSPDGNKLVESNKASGLYTWDLSGL